MKQIRFVEETNGQIKSDLNGVRYRRRDIHEDRIRYVPTIREPLVYSLVRDWRGMTRRKGKLSESRVRELYPLATEVTYVVKATGKVYQTIKIK